MDGTADGGRVGQAVGRGGRMAGHSPREDAPAMAEGRGNGDNWDRMGTCDR